MSNISKLQKRAISIFSWAVKGAGLAMLLLILVIAIGEGPPNPFKLSTKELFMMTSLLVTCFGLGFVLWRQLIGGVIILVGMIVFCVFNSRVPDLWVIHVLCLLGLLNVFYGWLKRKSLDV
ncbi:MAG: hypothetical protein KAS75_07215 [Planctomycetes bacterium]|nr:hypothetical protein [Planctomycetota bacterium]